MKTSVRPTKTGAYQFIVLPNTGIQICRGFPLRLADGVAPDELIRLAQRTAAAHRGNEVLRLVSEHIACNRQVEASDWICCDPNEFVFFRLVRAGAELHLDLVIDTLNGAGAQTRNKLPIALQNGLAVFRRRHHLADIFVEEHANARNEIGSLIMDFGNTGSAFVFARGGAGPLQARIVRPQNPFDPRYRDRPPAEANILRSNMIVLRVGPSPAEAPWIVLGARAEELIQEHPLTTYVQAPKKYVRFWPENLKAPEPTTKFRGILGQRDGLHPLLDLVRHTLTQMVQQVLASLTNPHGTSDQPELYPQVARLMATYPLTWREGDRRLMKEMLEEIAGELFAQDPGVKEQFQVELVCSEPMAVAAYVLWENFFHFGTDNLQLAASSLGNVRGTPELRMLVVDIGGGSTDIACVEIGWTVKPEDRSVDVTFKVLESMRFNRAGDRLSHIVAAALKVFLEEKHGLTEPLDFQLESRNPAFTLAYKRLVVSRIFDLAEAAKAVIAGPEQHWKLAPEDEYDLVRRLEPILSLDGLEERVRNGPHLEIDHATLETWARRDRQSLETNGEPGFMDIFCYLEELRYSLAPKSREPHVVILSGRTTRLPFIRRLTAKSLGLPPHRVRTLDTLLPSALRLQGHENMDKLAVVCGAQRFRFGDHIRFVALPEAPIFNRFIGTVRETSTGLKLNRVLIQPGDTRPRTLSIAVDAGRDVRIGHAFREDGSAQVIANLSNNSQVRRHEVKVDVLDDFTVRMAPHADVFLTEWVPGGTDLIVDNFNDTGRIDGEPPGFLSRIVRQDQQRWLR